VLDTVQMMLPFVAEIIDKNAATRRIAEYIDYSKFINGTRYNCEDAKAMRRTPLEHYKKVRENFNGGFISEKARSVAYCGMGTEHDQYNKQLTRVLHNIYLCKNKWCLNCQKQRQLTRLFRFGPELDKTLETHDLYHLVLTIPNCPDKLLDQEFRHIHKTFSKFINLFLVGEKRRPRKEFFGHGCIAAVRSSEITYNAENRCKGQEYHPHLHVILAMRKDLYMPKAKTHRKYSFDGHGSKRKLVRKFSEFELLLQKVWYLLINGERYSKKNLESVTDGYSVTLDPVGNDSYYEVFKYACKIYDEKSEPMTYEQHRVLDHALHGKRTMQGYGRWYGIQSDDDIEEGVHEAQSVVEAFLHRTEQPQRVYLGMNEIMNDMTKDLKFLYLNMKLIHTIGNKDLDKIRDMKSHADIHDMMKKLQEEKHDKAIEKRVINFKVFFEKLYGRLPNFQELEDYKRTLHVDRRGRVTTIGKCGEYSQITLDGDAVRIGEPKDTKKLKTPERKILGKFKTPEPIPEGVAPVQKEKPKRGMTAKELARDNAFAFDLPYKIEKYVTARTNETGQAPSQREVDGFVDGLVRQHEIAKLNRV